MKGKRAGAKAPFIESGDGPDHSRDLGKPVRKRCVIDRERDEYLEHIEDYETGQVLHHCQEPLSEHRGHGDAKR